MAPRRVHRDENLRKVALLPQMHAWGNLCQIAGCFAVNVQVGAVAGKQDALWSAGHTQTVGSCQLAGRRFDERRLAACQQTLHVDALPLMYQRESSRCWLFWDQAGS